MRPSVADLLRNPGTAFSLSLSDWDLLVPQLRQTRLLGTLRSLLAAQSDDDRKIPQEVWRHLDAGWLLHQKQRHSLDYELQHLVSALAEVDEPVLLLKGAAYLCGDLAPAAGRLISDIDILVHANKLPRIENVLSSYGWSAGAIDPYNERYYRRWMHEIPPLGHVERGSTLDVHHTLLPPTCDVAIDPSTLWAEARELQPGVKVLCPVDMVIHSAAHLFHEGEFDHGLRDLWDLDCLLRHFVKTEGADFYPQLLQRASDMKLLRPLYYALRYASSFFATPVDLAALQSMGLQQPSSAQIKLMDFLFVRAFTPKHSACRLSGTGLAEFSLYLRSHYLRMPLRLLLPHLIRKAWMDCFPAAASSKN
ncbi:nucleotidyltransferase family protein [Parahaliea sp. F7430]|uniref:Nucleotidyltransferase family protein n=1 Tax=Sediminihaliea albiluteola TaxID=2758564 RepID=A0A7W2YJ44_9GAMM|nr:nucleotidyltransferase family protein [Sediminihaliea albiluteola]MBA6412717.1 nucleotidyltransferase family protein [Sediminihaliea albiluteola]